MPSAEIYSASDARAERDQEMRKRGRVVPEYFIRPGVSMAKARKMAKTANEIVRLLKPLSYLERVEVLVPYRVILPS